MSLSVLGSDAVSRNVYVAPSLLARETELVGEVYVRLCPWLNRLAEDAEDFDDEAEAAVRAVHVIAQGGRADADAAHERLTGLARECEGTGDFDDASTARIARLAAAWLSIKVGRKLRADESDTDPWALFGGLVNVLALPRLEQDVRELFGALERELDSRSVDTALDALFPAMEPLLVLVAAAEEPDRIGVAEQLRRFAAGADIEVAAVVRRLEAVAVAAEGDHDPVSRRLATAARVAAVWLRRRSGDEPNSRGHRPVLTVSALAEQLVWARAGSPVQDAATVWWHPERCDLYAVNREIRAVYRQVTGGGMGDHHRPELSQAGYRDTVAEVVRRLEQLPRDRRLGLLRDWISPLLDEIAGDNRDFLDEPELETAEAVEVWRRIATGRDGDADVVHHHLTALGLIESEDQDPDMHVRSQAAFLAAAWLHLDAGHALRVDPDRFPRPLATPDLAELVNVLALTRARRVSVLARYLDDGPDLLDPLVELRALLVEAAA